MIPHASNVHNARQSNYLFYAGLLPCKGTRSPHVSCRILSNRVPQRSRWQGFRSKCSAEIFSKYLITGRCPMIPHASNVHNARKSNYLKHARLLACKHITSPHVSCRILRKRVPQRSRWQGFRSNCSAEIFSKYLITGRCPMIPHASTAHHAGKSNYLLHARLLACKHIYSPHVSCRILSNRVPQRSRWQEFRSKCSAEIFSTYLITGRCTHDPACQHCPPSTPIQLPVSCSFVGLQRYAQPTCFRI